MRVIVAYLTCIVATSSSAQELMNLQQYTPTNLLSPQQVEIKHFDNIYTQTAGFDRNGFRSKFSERSTFLNAVTHVYYGLNRLNVGLEFWISSARIEDRNNSSLRIFRFDGSQRTYCLTSVPKSVSFLLKNGQNCLLKLPLLVPITSDLEGNNERRYSFSMTGIYG